MFPRTRRHLRAAEPVVVAAPEEILATLDEDGALDGLPFMPEMLPYCGKRFQVSRRVEKTCVEGYWSQRLFPANDVVFLEELRCNGEQHDGCKRACMIFWKEAWLRPAKPGDPPVRVDDEELERLRSRLRVKRDPTHYYCQSTQLGAVTEAYPSRYKFSLVPQSIWVSLREIWVGNRSPLEVAALMLHGARLVLEKRRSESGVPIVPGPNKRTPTLSLGLRPGERVRVKSEAEIRATLDDDSRNRGLGMTKAMTARCGTEHRVRARLDRIILETTGEMREVENTVNLEGLECLCHRYHFGSCPRADLEYWREIWLTRCERSPSSGKERG